MRRRFAPDLLIALLLLVLPLIVFWPQTLGGKTLVPADNLFQWEPFANDRQVAGAPAVPHNALLSDLVLQNYAWKQFIRQSFAGGELPLWNPHLFAGVPFLAAGQHGALYPLSILYDVLPLWLAYGWFTVIQLWLAGLFMAAFARALGQGRLGATVAAVTWQLGSLMLASAVFPMILGTVAWLPFLLLCVEFVICQKPLLGRPSSLPWAALGAVGVGLMVLAGHAEMTYLTLLATGLYAALRLITAWWAGRRERQAGRRLLRCSAWLLALVALGLLISAVQLLPLYELASVNFREGGARFDQVLSWAYPPRHALALLMPNVFGSPAHHAYYDLFSGQVVPATTNAGGGAIDTIFFGQKNYVEGAAYVGILPLALAAFALWEGWARRRVKDPAPPYRAILAGIAALAVTFIFGLPTYILIYALPLLNQSHTPFRWVYPLALCVAVLAGFGAEALARRPSNDDQSVGARQASPLQPPADRPRPGGEVEVRAGARRFGWILIVLGALILIGLLLSRLFFTQIEPLVDGVFRALAGADYAFADARMFYSYEFPNVFFCGLFTLLAGLVFLLSRRDWRIRRLPLWMAGAVAVIAADLMIASWGFNPAVDPALLDYTPPALAWLQDRYAGDGPFRVTSLDVGGQPGVMPANIPWLFGLEDVRGYDSMIPRQYTDYMALISPQVQLDFNRVAPLYADRMEALDSPLLHLLGVRYVVTTAEIDHPGYALAWEDAGSPVRIYENLNALPRAYTISEEDTGWPLNIEPPSFDGHWLMYQPQPQTISEYGNIQVTVEAALDGPSWLTLTDSYFPGWRAYVRPQGASEDYEQEVPVELVNGNFRAVFLDPAALAAHYDGLDSPPAISDTWTVRFRYSPASFQVGAFLSFMSAAVLVFALMVWAWRALYGARADAGSDSGVARVARNSITPIVLNLFNKGLDFAFAFIMLRILGPADAGIYYYAIVVFGWFDILTNFGLNTFLTREVARDRARARHYLVNTSLLRGGLAGLGLPLLILFLAARQATVSPPLDATAIAAIGLLYVGLLPNSLSTGMSALFYAFEQAEVPAAIATVSTISKAVLGLGALLLGWGVVGLAGVSILTNLITLGVMLWAARGILAPPPSPLPSGEEGEQGSPEAPFPQHWGKGRGWGLDRGLLRHMVGESFPLMLNHFLATIFYKINVILLEAMLGAALVGKYSTAYKWLDALQVIPSFFTLALFPVMSRQAQEDLGAFTRSTRLAIKLLVLTALPIAVATTFLAEALIGLLGGREFLPEGGLALQIMVWSIPIGWINSVVQYVLIALDRQRIITRAFAVAVTFNVVSNLVFIPLYGYAAAAVITILSEGVLLGLFGYVLHKTLRARSDDSSARVPWVGMLWRPALAAGVMLAAMALGWSLHPLVGLAAMVVYPLMLAALNPLDAHEQRQFARLLPGRLRSRLGFLLPAARG